MLYTEVEENIKYLKDILENEEKPKAVELKKRSEDFVNKVSRNGVLLEEVHLMMKVQ